LDLPELLDLLELLELPLMLPLLLLLIWHRQVLVFLVGKLRI